MNRGKDYTQTFFLANEDELVRRYPHTQLETASGDVVFLHFLTIHQSGWNRSSRHSRVTCQVRLFDMADPLSVTQNWVGGWQDGADFTALHPDKVI
jgi:ectoine hydroxylase-related dioxygenase (phytanoyl-CoA dioxygenase family)